MIVQLKEEFERKLQQLRDSNGTDSKDVSIGHHGEEIEYQCDATARVSALEERIGSSRTRRRNQQRKRRCSHRVISDGKNCNTSNGETVGAAAPAPGLVAALLKSSRSKRRRVRRERNAEQHKYTRELILQSWSSLEASWDDLG